MAFKGAITWVGALDHARKRRVDAETVAMRAYVTSGCPASNDARAKCRACALRPHATSCGELKARGTRAARRPLRTHRPLAAISGCGSGGRSATPVFLCRRHHLRWQRSGHRGTRRSPSSRRGRAKQHAQEQSRRSRYPEVAPRRTDLVLSAEPVSCSRRVSVHDRGNETTSLGLSRRRKV